MNLKFTVSRIIKVLVAVILCLALLIPMIAPIYGSTYIDTKFRNGAYFHYSYETDVDDIRFDALDYIIYAFIEPYPDGNFRPMPKPEQLRELVEKAHSHGVKVFIGMGGGSSAMDFNSVASNDNSIFRYLKNVIEIIEEYNLDGVDMDWESPLLGESSENCEKLMKAMKEELKPRGLYFTAAISGTYNAETGIPTQTEGWTKECLETFDWVHIMTYSLHRTNSPLWFPDVSLDYWHKVKGVPQEKLVVGVPFYGLPSWKTYKDIVAENPDLAYIDYLPAEGEIDETNYNGINTIREKVKMSLKKGGGMFSWVVNVDSNTQYNLTQTIYDTMKEAREMGVDKFVDKVTVIFQNREIMYSDDMGYPFIDANNRTMIPARQSGTALGFTISFDSETNTAIAKSASKTIEMPIGEKYIVVDGKTVEIDTESVVVDGRTYIPLKAFFEAAGYEIDEWHNNTRTAYIK